MVNKKLRRLHDILKPMGSVLIAFSGGVDSTFLLKTSKDALSDMVLAVTALSATYPQSEVLAAKNLAKKLKVNHQCIKTNELNCKDFTRNPPKRCYFCKRELFSQLKSLARKKGYAFVIEGSNLDDSKDYRPGLKALRELGIRSPLQEAGLSKKEIRTLSKKMGLPTFDKPSLACLASRIPYGCSIDKKSLHMVEQAEKYLHNLNFNQCRVRHHGSIARIEIEPEDMEQFQDQSVRRKIVARFKRIGFNYITLDLQGYRSGSMNEPLP